MTNELKERLERLSAAVRRASFTKTSIAFLAETEIVLRGALQEAYNRGDLVTRQEMETREAILVKALRFIDETISWEINTGNYDHSDVCEMDRSWCEIGEVAEKALDSVADHPLEQQTFTRQELDEAVAKAVAEEREACAVIVEEYGEEAGKDPYDDYSPQTAHWAAEAIRARSSNKEGE